MTEAGMDGGDPVDTELAAAPLLRSTAVMSVGTALSRITGLLRLSAIGYAIGAAHSQIADAYNVANNTPNIVYELVLGGILTSVFVPVFVQWLQDHGRGEAWEVARSVMTIAVVVLSAIAVLTIVLAPWIVDLYTIRLGHGPGADAERAVATFFLRWFMPQIVFYGLGAVATGLLNAHRRFAAPMFAPILNNLVVIGTMVAFVALGTTSASVAGITDAQRYVLAIGTTLGVVGMTVALWPSLRRLEFRFAWRWNWRSEAVLRIGRLALWVLLYVVVNQLGLIVVIVLGTGARNYSAYFNAFILFQLPHAIFAVSIMTALLPALSGHWANRETAEFRSLLARGIRLTALIVVPAALGYIALAGPIVRLLLQRGATSAADAAAVANVLRFFAIGLFSFSAFQLLLRAFYAMQDSRTPALVNVAAVGLNTAVNFLFFHLLGVKGLALGLATAYTFGAVVLVVLIRRRLGGLDGRNVAAGLGKVVVAGAATAGAAFGVSKLLGRAIGTSTLPEQSVQVLGSVVVGLLVFVAMALLLRMEDLRQVIGTVTGRFRR
ncbi:MAG: murein biosynthesis integral membrane protein MurJ [Actinomycetota bacterium]